MSRSRRLFRLFAKGNPPFVQARPAFTCYAIMCQGGGVLLCWLLNFHYPSLNQEENTLRLLSTLMVQVSTP